MYTVYSITVAASDKNDLKASFSSYGTCVEIIAPVSDPLFTLAIADCME